MNPEPARRLLSESELGSCFRPRDAEEAGINYHQLCRLEEAGIVERERRGLYRRTDVNPTRFSDLAAVCAQVPDAVVCLLTALTVHEIGTQLPNRIWIAIPQHRRTPVLARAGLEIVRFSGLPLRYGVVDADFEGVSAQITNPARTVVDCFRFRNRIGVHIGYEALDDVLAHCGRMPCQVTHRADPRCKGILMSAPGERK